VKFQFKVKCSTITEAQLQGAKSPDISSSNDEIGLWSSPTTMIFSKSSPLLVDNAGNDNGAEWPFYRLTASPVSMTIDVLTYVTTQVTITRIVKWLLCVLPILFKYSICDITERL